MSKVRVLAGTRKGAFILEADGKRDKWDVSGPHFAGWEIYHMKASPADPNRIYASQSSSWSGQVIQRSRDGGKTWETPGGGPQKSPQGWPMGESNKFVYDTSPETGAPLTTHQFYDGTQHPWEFKRVWHLEPSLTDPDTVFAGIEDAALFRSTNGAASWQELSGLRGHGTGPHWQPGAGGMCLHTIILDHSDPDRMYIAISAAGAFRTDDGGTTWKPINRGLRSQFLPDQDSEVGHCVHHVAMHPSRPNVLFMQKHWDVMRSDDAGDNWKEVSGNLPTDFGFVIDVHAHEPETIYVVPDQERRRALSSRRQAARLSQPHRRQRVGGADQGLAAGQLLRQCAARRHGRRSARLLRRLLWHHRRSGLLVGRCGRQLDADRPRPSARALGRGADAGVSAGRHGTLIHSWQ